MTVEQYEEFIILSYSCNRCSGIGPQAPGETKFVKDYTFWVFSKACTYCNGTGIPAIPWGELRGQTYEAWKESSPSLPQAPPKRRKRRARKGNRKSPYHAG